MPLAVVLGLAGIRPFPRGSRGDDSQCFAIDRLRAVPFAAYCRDCEEQRGREARPSKEWIDEPLIHRWDLPPEMEITTDLPRGESSPGPEELAIEITTENQPSTRPRRAKKGRPRRQLE